MVQAVEVGKKTKLKVLLLLSDQGRMQHEGITHSQTVLWLPCRFWFSLVLLHTSIRRLYGASEAPPHADCRNFPVQFPSPSPSHAQIALQSSHDPSQLCSVHVCLAPTTSPSLPPQPLYSKLGSLRGSSGQAPLLSGGPFLLSDLLSQIPGAPNSYLVSQRLPFRFLD